MLVVKYANQEEKQPRTKKVVCDSNEKDQKGEKGNSMILDNGGMMFSVWIVIHLDIDMG